MKRAVARAETAATTVAAVPEVALLAFKLAGQDYALPLDHVREAMIVPPEVMAMPRTDAAMAGVVASRGALLPLVFTRVLLGLPDRPLQGGERVIVTTIGDSAIGLVVDRLTAILRAPEDRIGATPPVLNRGRGEAQIEAIYRRPDGRGLVSILSPTRLFEDESVARLLEDGRQQHGAAMAETETVSDAANAERFVVFRLGEEAYGLPVAAVDEIVRMPDQLTRVPNAPGFVEGVMNLRGRVVPVIDQRDRFQAPAGDTARTRRRVIVATFGGLQAGFAVDEVSEILELTPDQMRATPELAAEGGKLFDRIGTASVDGRLVLLVDPEALLDKAEADLLAELADASRS